MENKKAAKLNWLKLPIVVSVIIVVLISYKHFGLIAGVFKNTKLPKKSESTSAATSVKEPTFDLTQWKEYNNSDYRFILKVPPLLLSRQLENQTDYLLFVKFEENRYSKDSGVALGVTDRTIEEEAKKIRKDIEKIASVVPKEKKIKVDGVDALKIDYEKVKDFEEKSIIVVGKDKITVSVSTTPGQIENIVSSFNFY